MDADRHRRGELIAGQDGQRKICVNLRESAVKFLKTYQGNAMRHARCALRDQRGVALLEVLMAGVILAIAIIGLAVMFSWGQSFVVAQGDDRLALNLAQQRIESLRAFGYTAAEALNSNCGGTPEADENLTAGVGNAQPFTRQTAVEHVNDTNLTTPECGTDSIRVTVTVTVNMLQGDPVTLQTVLTTF